MQRGFAAARGADDYDELAIRDVACDAGDYNRGTKAFLDVVQGNLSHFLFLTIDTAADKQPLHAYDDNHRGDHRKD